MKSEVLVGALTKFNKDKRFHAGKGTLAVALIVTQRAKGMEFPLDPDLFLAKSGTQVKGLSGDAVQVILERHGIQRRLGTEVGRTNRGAKNNMTDYVAFLNDAHSKGILDLQVAEAFWANEVQTFFNRRPFTIKLDSAHGLRAVVRDVINQARERQKESTGTHYAGAVLQYLVGAKLDCALGLGLFEHNSFTAADAPGNRAGDFLVGDVAIHVTTNPSEGLLRRCEQNLSGGIRPIIVTTEKGVDVADGLASNRGLADRIDIFEIEQFVALNLYELGKFAAEGRRVAVNDVIDRYNAIVDEVDTDPSLKIEFKK